MMIRRDVPLAPLTTLQLGGSADFFAAPASTPELLEAIEWGRSRCVPIGLLAGGSNTVVPDAGFRGLVIHMRLRGIREVDGRHHVAAGEDWDMFVDRCVVQGWAGVECLGGIPGSVGATPIQNVGAYGQDVSETIESVHGIDLKTMTSTDVPAEACGFAYRDSAFKRDPGRFLVTEVVYKLEPGGAPARRYAELIEQTEPGANLSAVHAKVIELRRRKSMVLDKSDPNSVSAGSFFTNPIVSDDVASRVRAKAEAAGLLTGGATMPSWPSGAGMTKLAAGWLIEKAGFPRGTRAGHVGQSAKHALALVHHGGGTTGELLAFADAIAAGVQATFDVRLEREPRMLAPLRIG